MVITAMTAALLAASLPADHAVLVTAPGVVESVASLETLRDAQPESTVWVWNDGQPPARCPAREIAGCETPSGGETLRLYLKGLSEQEQGRVEGRVIAAPMEMWQEVPEAHLPAWPIEPGRPVTLLRAPSQAYRIRVLAGSLGSSWVDVPASRDREHVTLWPAEDFSLDVRSAAGDPVPDPSVAVVAGRGMEKTLTIIAWGETGRDGRWTVPSAPSGIELRILVAADGYVPAVHRGLPGRLGERAAVLDMGVVVEGSVRDSHGGVPAGLKVLSEFWLDGEVAIPWTLNGEVRDDGTFRVAGLQRGPSIVRVMADGYSEARLEIDLDEARENLGTIVLADSLHVLLLILDDAGTPVAKGMVRPSCGPGISIAENGQARVSGVPSTGPCTISIVAPGHISKTVEISPPHPDQIEVTISRAFRVFGRFVDCDGQPVLNGEVEVRNGDRRMFDEVGPDGTFEIDLPPGTDHAIRLSSSSTGWIEEVVRAGPPGGFEDLGSLRAPPGIVAAGTVVDAIGSPLQGATLWTPRPGEGGARLAFLRDDVVRARTDAEGRFRISGLPESPVILRIDSPRTARGHVRVAPEPGRRHVELGTLEVGEGSVVSVRTDARSGHRGEAMIDLRGEGLEMDFLHAPLTDGEAAIERVPVGSFEVRVVGSGGVEICSKQVVVAEHGGSVDVECQDDPLYVTGEVIQSGEWASGGALMWMRGSTGAAPAVIMQNRTWGGATRYDVLGATGQVNVSVDLDGRFETEELRPGEWEVTFVSPRAIPTAPRLITVPDVGEHHVTLEFGGHRVRGRVVNRADDPESGCRVRELTTSAMAFSASDGSFEFEDLAADVVRLVARCDDRSSEVVSVRSSEAGRIDEIVLRVRQIQDELVACVRREFGASGSNGFAFLETDTTGARVKWLDADGCARFPLSPPTPSRARIAAHSGGEWAFGGWTEIVESAEIELIVGETGGFEVTCDSECGPVAVRSSAGWNVSALLTFLGAPPVADPQGTTRILGLPAGRYDVSLVDAPAWGESVWVREGELSRIDVR